MFYFEIYRALCMFDIQHVYNTFMYPNRWQWSVLTNNVSSKELLHSLLWAEGRLLRNSNRQKGASGFVTSACKRQSLQLSIASASTLVHDRKIWLWLYGIDKKVSKTCTIFNHCMLLLFVGNAHLLLPHNAVQIVVTNSKVPKIHKD